jgi:putative tryptophan/tyrosine transport system substrate-binding protein
VIAWRRFVLALAFLAALAWAAQAQQPARTWRVGCLVSFPKPQSPIEDYWSAFTQRLNELGYVEGRNLIVERRFTEGKYERLPDFAADLIRRNVEVIVTDGTPPTIVARKTTKTLPIVFASAGDPVANGLAESMARPGGNVTGISLMSIDTTAKRTELLLRVFPRLARLAVLFNPANQYSQLALKQVQAAASTLNVEVVTFETRSPRDIEDAFTSMHGARVSAFITITDAFLNSARRRIAEVAMQHQMGGIGSGSTFAEVGGLMGYGPDPFWSFRRAADYVDRIFQGGNPAEMPIEQPTKLELVINLRTAKALGLTIPPEILVQADKVIE